MIGERVARLDPHQSAHAAIRGCAMPRARVSARAARRPPPRGASRRTNTSWTRAIPLLPPRIRPFFLANQTHRSSSTRSIRTCGARPAGSRSRRGTSSTWMPTGRIPFPDLPHDRGGSRRALRREFVDKNGHAAVARPQEIYKKLVEAFTQKAAVLARQHQVLLVGARPLRRATRTCRSTPRSTTTGSSPASGASTRGSRPSCSSATAPRCVVTPAPVGAGAPTRASSSSTTLTESFTFVAADPRRRQGRGRRRARSTTTATSRCSSARSGRFSSSGWPTRSRDVASMITAAWVEAGRPAVPLDAAAHAAQGQASVVQSLSSDPADVRAGECAGRARPRAGGGRAARRASRPSR